MEPLSNMPFQCGDGTCLDFKKVINNCINDCADGSDESIKTR